MAVPRQRLPEVDWPRVRQDGFTIFTKLIRTKDANEVEQCQELHVPGRVRLSRCLTTMDLTSLGVGSCVGTGMYLVAGMVARNYSGPGVIISFIIAAIASIFSGVCYAEFGVRVPHTTGSAYSYSYVTVGEFIAFIIGWNMTLEYLIGTSACARALSACVDSLTNGSMSEYMAATVGTIYGRPPDFLAFAITLLMTLLLLAGVRKSLMFTNILNGINLCIWVFIMGAGVFYIDFDNWTKHQGFMPYGWSGVFRGAATCFYAFIGFDIIATTGEEAQNPKRSIPLSILMSLIIILAAYVSSSVVLTLVVPYDQVKTDSALVQMFGQVNAPTCKYIVAIGAVSGLTVSMFGSMFPMPRIMYAMAQDGLIHKSLGTINERTGTPAAATLLGGVSAAFVALFVQLEVLVEMMSIGTLLAYTLVSSCVLVLRYQPHSTNLIELLPQRLRTPVSEAGTGDAVPGFIGDGNGNQRVMVRRVTRSSPDSDDTMPGDESDGRDDTFLVSDSAGNKFYGTVSGGSAGNTTACGRFFNSLARRLQGMYYLCPGCCPWIDCGPATEQSGMFVMKGVVLLYGLIITFDMFAAYGNPGDGAFTNLMMVLLLVSIVVVLLLISRKPENRSSLVYATPGLPFLPTIAITVNVYLILNLSVLTLIRFTVWMAIGLVVYFKYGIKNSSLESVRAPPPPPPPKPRELDRTTLPPAPAPPVQSDRNIFQGDNDSNRGLYDYPDPLLAWHESEITTPKSKPMRVEQRYNERTNKTTSHATRPPWANPDKDVLNAWDD